MADSATSRVEPSIGPAPVSAMAADELRATVEPAASAQPPSEAPGSRSALDQLSRIEDKTARIEDRYERSEAPLARMGDRLDTSGAVLNEAARQAEV